MVFKLKIKCSAIRIGPNMIKTRPIPAPEKINYKNFGGSMVGGVDNA